MTAIARTQQALPICLVDDPDVTRLVSVHDTLDAARDAAIEAAAGRISTARSSVRWDTGEVRVLQAAAPGLDLFGFKQFHYVDDIGVRYSVHVFRTSDGVPLGVVDAATLTPLRTAATAAVAVEALVGGSDAALALIGSGTEARAGLRALAEVVRLTSVTVTSRRPINREAFAADMSSELGIEIRVADTAREAIAGADIAYAATQSQGSIVLADDDLGNLSLLVSIGSTMPNQRELAGDIFRRSATVIVDTPDALRDSGDLIEAVEEGFDPASVRRLGDVLAQPRPSVPLASRTVFKSIGSADQDLVLAALVLRRAQENDAGRQVVPAMSLKHNL
jgi:alanine dehydrogenase